MKMMFDDALGLQFTLCHGKPRWISPWSICSIYRESGRRFGNNKRNPAFLLLPSVASVPLVALHLPVLPVVIVGPVAAAVGCLRSLSPPQSSRHRRLALPPQSISLAFYLFRTWEFLHLPLKSISLAFVTIVWFFLRRLIVVARCITRLKTLRLRIWIGLNCGNFRGETLELRWGFWLFLFIP